MDQIFVEPLLVPHYPTILVRFRVVEPDRSPGFSAEEPVEVWSSFVFAAFGGGVALRAPHAEDPCSSCQLLLALAHGSPNLAPLCTTS
eukprot:m.222803 g.222803  ORF g.222803 m.222803 type:complete len:88 (-) comp15631_c0_seq1:312-575(-)